MNDVPQCSSCKHFRVQASDINLGQCMRYPPQVYPLPGPHGQIVTWSDFPIVKRKQGCGEYATRLDGLT